MHFGRTGRCDRDENIPRTETKICDIYPRGNSSWQQNLKNISTYEVYMTKKVVITVEKLKNGDVGRVCLKYWQMKDMLLKQKTCKFYLFLCLKQI